MCVPVAPIHHGLHIVYARLTDKMCKPAIKKYIKFYKKVVDIESGICYNGITQREEKQKGTALGVEGRHPIVRNFSLWSRTEIPFPFARFGHGEVLWA